MIPITINFNTGVLLSDLFWFLILSKSWSQNVIVLHNKGRKYLLLRLTIIGEKTKLEKIQ